MAELLCVPLKKPTEVDVVKPLKNLIQSAYNNSSHETSNHYSEAVTEFSKLRNVAIWKPFEKYESSLEIIYNYYDQLCSLETKIPAHELQIPFKWKDAFDKGTIFGGRMSLTLSSLAYEKVCILFNIAALQSGIAASQNIETDDGLKLASKLFQHSAGIFSQLKALAPAAIAQEPTTDLTADVLSILSNLMVAQAQEIFVIKAIRDSMKDMIVAKLASQCEELYADVLRGLQKDALRGNWDKDWVTTIAGKQAGMHAMTQFYHSLVCRTNNTFGEEISRLQQAVELFKAAQSRSGKPHLYEEYLNRAQRNLIESKKDNDFIYNEMIPDVKTLAPPGKAQLSKVIPIPARMSQNFKDLFAELIPVALHQAITACDSRKNEIVNVEVMKLREATQTLNCVLANLNLPAAIEITGSTGLPPSLLEKANSVREKGGIDSIRALISEMPESLKRNRELLDESERLLDEERDSDNQLRGQFKERWTRTPSAKLTEMFRSNAGKYREIINNAVTADKIVRSKFDTHFNGMDILSKSPGEIQEAIPSGGGGNNVTNSSSVQKLRSLMNTVETIKAERDVIESELKSATIDMKDQFLQALAADGAINEPAMSISYIGKTLSPLQSQTQDSVERQESLIVEIQAAHAQFTEENGAGMGTRETLFSQLAAAYDMFIELQNNLKEGNKFYNDLTQLLVMFQNKISDYCFARKTEKEELLKDLTQESSRQTPGATPTMPSHYNTSPTGSAGAETPTAQAPAPAPMNPGGNVVYPSQIHGMPVPYGATANTPYPAYVPAPMPQSFNPYATLPYPQNPYNYQGFPQGPPQHYGTYPGAYQQPPQQQQQPHNPNYQPPPAGW